MARYIDADFEISHWESTARTVGGEWIRVTEEERAFYLKTIRHAGELLQSKEEDPAMQAYNDLLQVAWKFYQEVMKRVRNKKE